MNILSKIVSEKTANSLSFPSEINKINKKGEEMIKPQENFNIDDFDNDISIPFVPKIKEKANSLIPLQDIIIEAQKEGKNFFEKLSPDYEFPHPYQYELENLEYNQEQLSVNISCQNPRKFDKDDYYYISTTEELQVHFLFLFP